MGWLRRLQIYHKLNGIIVGMLLLLSLLVGVVMRQSTMQLLGHHLEKRGIEVGNYLAALSANDILLDNHYALYERVNKTAGNTEDIRYILITDYAGRILAHTFPTGLPKGLPAFRQPDSDAAAASSFQVMTFDSNEGSIREVMVPIENGDIGYVRVGMSENTTRELLDHRSRDFFVSTLLVCAIASLLATWLALVLLRPIRSLAKAVEEIRGGNLSAQVEQVTEDEVGSLALAFNEMAAGLKQKELENNQLLDQLRDKEAMRTVLINKLFTAQEDERKRISRELHDEAGQSLTSLLAYMKVLLSRLTDPEQRQILQESRDVAMGVLAEVKTMAVELRPPVLDDHGIVAAIEKYVTNFTKQYGIRTHFTAPESRVVLDDQISLALYRIVQEGLTNIAKHAQAAHAEIVLSMQENDIILMVVDDGCGIAPGTLEEARKNNHLGLYGMRERVELLGGKFSLASSAGGTVITIRLKVDLG